MVLVHSYEEDDEKEWRVEGEKWKFTWGDLLGRLASWKIINGLILIHFLNLVGSLAQICYL